MSAETGIAPTEQQRPEYLHFSPDHISGLQARLALGGDALDPTKPFDRQITPDMVVELADRDLTKVVAAVTLQGASKESVPTHTDWAVSYGKVLDSKQNKANVAKLAQIIGKSGIAIAGDNGTRVAEAVHKRYFQTGKSIEMKKGTETKAYQAVDLTQLVEDILAGYTLENKINYDKLKEDRKEIMWFLKIFPKGSDEIIWALVDEEAKRRSNPNGFYANINAEVQVTQGSIRKTVRRFEPDALTAYEKKMLNLIWHGKEVPIAPQPTVEHLPDPAKQPPLEKNRRYNVVDIYRSIPHPPSTRNPYFIDNVSDDIQITQVERQSLITTVPFFLLSPGSLGRLRMDMNPDAAAFVSKLQLELNDKRYIAAEAVTNNDSGVFALCAASAKTPLEQTKLFHHVAREIIRVHETSANHLLAWLTQQTTLQHSGRSSMDVFYTNDLSNNRPADERLLAEGNTPQEIVRNTFNKWGPIIEELSDKLTSDQQLTLMDLRKIEFLAHSIKVDKLLELIKSRSSN